ncbi:sigma factor [Tessaracoccus coleopterorum]|nr:sigma factor [Tessaracoccus coleopterorum]
MTETAAQADPLSVDQVRDFDRFVKTRSGRLYRAAWFLTGDGHKAEDLVQAALAKAYPHYLRVADDEEFEAYLRTTMYRTYIQWWRRRWNGEVPTGALPEGATGAARADADRPGPCPGRAAEDATRRHGAALLRGPVRRGDGRAARYLRGIRQDPLLTGCASLSRSTHLSEEAS